LEVRAYTGEMKKGIFGVLNYVLPHEKGVLSMHCSANEGVERRCSFIFWIKWNWQNNLKC
jgi:phosphoenolpyruvate carboxykinase (ATP)